MNNQMTLLAFAGKWDARGASGLTEDAFVGTDGDANNVWLSNVESASRPIPLPARLRNARREGKTGCGGAKTRSKTMPTSRRSRKTGSARRGGPGAGSTGHGRAARSARPGLLSLPPEPDAGRELPLAQERRASAERHRRVRPP